MLTITKLSVPLEDEILSVGSNREVSATAYQQINGTSVIGAPGILLG